MVHATIRMKMPEQRVRAAVEILRSVAERTRVRSGCLSCRIYQDIQEKHLIMLDEMWSTQEELNSHLRSDEYSKVLLVVEMANETPEILFSRVFDSTGVETIEKARSKTME